MKKNFRNRFLAVTAVASMSFLLLSGFDSTLTVEEVTQKMNESLAEMGGLNVDAQGIADISIDVLAGGEAQSLDISGLADYSIVMTLDPFVMGVNASLSGDASAMGMEGSVEIESYIVEKEDGSGIVYARMPVEGDTGWHAAAMTSEDMETMLSSVKAAFSGDIETAASGMGIDIASWKEKLSANTTLAPEAVNVNGIDCYEITQSVDGDTLFTIVSEALEAMPQAGIDSASLSAFQMLFSGIRMNAISDCKVEDFTPVYAEMDFSGSDFSMIGQMVGAMMFSSEDSSEMPEINVNVNALNLSMTYGDVPDQVEIPAEALAAEIETTVSMSDVAEAAEALE